MNLDAALFACSSLILSYAWYTVFLRYAREHRTGVHLEYRRPKAERANYSVFEWYWAQGTTLWLLESRHRGAQSAWLSAAPPSAGKEAWPNRQRCLWHGWQVKKG